MSPPPVSVSCPSCATDLTAVVAVTDGGEAGVGDGLYGEDVQCGHCDAEFEVLFYPE